jgi:uncharacterized membrane protein YdjX (TVP38/TMEM64 family)
MLADRGRPFLRSTSHETRVVPGTRRIGVRSVFASRLLPGSAVVNVLAAAGEIPLRRFVAAAALGDLAFAAAVAGVGAGGAALFQAFLPGLAALVAVTGLLLLRARSSAGGKAPAPAIRRAHSM